MIDSFIVQGAGSVPPRLVGSMSTPYRDFVGADVGVGPYEKEGKPHRPPWPAAQSGSSAARMQEIDGGCGREHPQSVQQPRAIPQSRQSRDSSLYTREPWPAGDGADIARPSEFPAAPGGAGQSPPPTRTPRVPICGPMYLRHGFRRPNFVPKFGASVIGIGPYERTRGYGFPCRFAPRNDSTNAGSRSAGPSSTSFSARRSVRNDRRRQSFQLSSHVSTSFVTARSEAPAPVSPKSPVTPERFPKEGPKPFLWSFQGGLGGNSKSPQNFSSGVWGCILSIRKEYIPRCRQASLAPPAGRPAPTGGGSLSPRQKADSPPLRAPPEYPPPPAYSPSPPAPSGPGR